MVGGGVVVEWGAETSAQLAGHPVIVWMSRPFNVAVATAWGPAWLRPPRAKTHRRSHVPCSRVWWARSAPRHRMFGPAFSSDNAGDGHTSCSEAERKLLDVLTSHGLHLSTILQALLAVTLQEGGGAAAPQVRKADFAGAVRSSSSLVTPPPSPNGTHSPQGPTTVLFNAEAARVHVREKDAARRQSRLRFEEWKKLKVDGQAFDAAVRWLHIKWVGGQVKEFFAKWIWLSRQVTVLDEARYTEVMHLLRLARREPLRPNTPMAPRKEPTPQPHPRPSPPPPLPAALYPSNVVARDEESGAGEGRGAELSPIAGGGSEEAPCPPKPAKSTGERQEREPQAEPSTGAGVMRRLQKDRAERRSAQQANELATALEVTIGVKKSKKNLRKKEARRRKEELDLDRMKAERESAKANTSSQVQEGTEGEVQVKEEASPLPAGGAGMGTEEGEGGEGGVRGNKGEQKGDRGERGEGGEGVARVVASCAEEVTEETIEVEIANVLQDYEMYLLDSEPFRAAKLHAATMIKERSPPVSQEGTNWTGSAVRAQEDGPPPAEVVTSGVFEEGAAPLVPADDARRVGVSCVEKVGDGEVAVSLCCSSTLCDAVKVICGRLETPFSDRKAVLFRVDAEGWSEEVTEDESLFSSQQSFVSIAMLRDGDRVEVRRSSALDEVQKKLCGFSSIGAKFRLSHMAQQDKFNESLQTKLACLSTSYAGYRKIRGDGNCYFRAVVFGLLEQLICRGNREGFQLIIDCFRSFEPGNGKFKARHYNLLRYLGHAAEGSKWNTVAELEADLLSEATHLDEAVVRASRWLAGKYLLEHGDELRNGLSISDACTLTLGVDSLQAFCDRAVWAMGECAEGAFVDLGVLPSALGCDSHIAFLSRESNVELTVLDARAEGVHGARFEPIHLLLRPGHFDLLYARSSKLEEGMEGKGGEAAMDTPSQAHAEAEWEVQVGEEANLLVARRRLEEARTKLFVLQKVRTESAARPEQCSPGERYRRKLEECSFFTAEYDVKTALFLVRTEEDDLAERREAAAAEEIAAAGRLQAVQTRCVRGSGEGGTVDTAERRVVVEVAVWSEGGEDGVGSAVAGARKRLLHATQHFDDSAVSKVEVEQAKADSKGALQQLQPVREADKQEYADGTGGPGGAADQRDIACKGATSTTSSLPTNSGALVDTTSFSSTLGRHSTSIPCQGGDDTGTARLFALALGDRFLTNTNIVEVLGSIGANTAVPEQRVSKAKEASEGGGGCTGPLNEVGRDGGEVGMDEGTKDDPLLGGRRMEGEGAAGGGGGGDSADEESEGSSEVDLDGPFRNGVCVRLCGGGKGKTSWWGVEMVAPSGPVNVGYGGCPSNLNTKPEEEALHIELMGFIKAMELLLVHKIPEEAEDDYRLELCFTKVEMAISKKTFDVIARGSNLDRRKGRRGKANSFALSCGWIGWAATLLFDADMMWGSALQFVFVPPQQAGGTGEEAQERLCKTRSSLGRGGENAEDAALFLRTFREGFWPLDDAEVYVQNHVYLCDLWERNPMFYERVHLPSKHELNCTAFHGEGGDMWEGTSSRWTITSNDLFEWARDDLDNPILEDRKVAKLCLEACREFDKATLRLLEAALAVAAAPLGSFTRKDAVGRLHEAEDFQVDLRDRVGRARLACWGSTLDERCERGKLWDEDTGRVWGEIVGEDIAPRRSKGWDWSSWEKAARLKLEESWESSSGTSGQDEGSYEEEGEDLDFSPKEGGGEEGEEEADFFSSAGGGGGGGVEDEEGAY